LSLINRKQKYVAEKTTGPLKSKQATITTVLCPILSVDRLPTPLIFRYPLPLKGMICHFLNLIVCSSSLQARRREEAEAEKTDEEDMEEVTDYFLYIS
jgi:hypothetical protein